jgi:hypothetical protein
MDGNCYFFRVTRCQSRLLNLLETFFVAHQLINTFLWNLSKATISLVYPWIELEFSSFCQSVIFLSYIPMGSHHEASHKRWYQLTKYHFLMNIYSFLMLMVTYRVDCQHCISIFNWKILFFWQIQNRLF